MGLKTLFRNLVMKRTPLDADTLAVRLAAEEILKDKTLDPAARKAELEKVAEDYVAALVGRAPEVSLEKAADDENDPTDPTETGDDDQDEALVSKNDDEETTMDEATVKALIKSETATLIAVNKQLTDQNAALAKQVSALEAANATNVRLAKAKTLAGATGQFDAVATVLAKCEGDENAEKALSGLLTALGAAQSDAQLLKTLGGSGPEPTDVQKAALTAVEAKVAELRKAQPTLSVAKATRAVYQAHPELYAALRSSK